LKYVEPIGQKLFFRELQENFSYICKKIKMGYLAVIKKMKMVGTLLNVSNKIK
jgi:hypothetical protein